MLAQVSDALDLQAEGTGDQAGGLERFALRAAEDDGRGAKGGEPRGEALGLEVSLAGKRPVARGDGWLDLRRGVAHQDEAAHGRWLPFLPNPMCTFCQATN